MTKCYFICINGMDESPILPIEMEPPAVGSVLFFEGESHGYRVKDVQYQLRKTAHLDNTPHLTYHEVKFHQLICINVIIERIDNRRII